MPRIRDFVERDGVYVGSSAGSKIMGPSIDIELTPDENEVGLQNLTGFGIVPFYIVPHWESKDDELREKMLKYGEESGKQVIPLSDQQGILILDNGYEII